MAHQAHNLPWNTLADNFKFVYANARYKNCTNLYPRFKPGQGSQLQHFARVFARVLDSSSSQERQKFPNAEDADQDEPDELFISPAAASRIARTVKWDNEQTLAEEKRRLSYWVMEITDPTYPHADKSQREMVEMLKTLLLYGDMEPLLRFARQPLVNMECIWDYPEEDCLSEMIEKFLTTYICLNVLVLKPELWDPTSRSESLDSFRKYATPRSRDKAVPENWDYRLTKGYQLMLVKAVTAQWNHDERVATYPHREFFGVTKDVYSSGLRWQRAKFGLGPISDLVDKRCRNLRLPHKSDIPIVINLLGRKGLPAELALDVLELAEYGGTMRRLPVADDPLHLENREELRKYLGYCWRVLTRLDMLIKENDKWIDWEFEVTGAIHQLWGVVYPKMSEVVDATMCEDRRPGEVDMYRRLRTFI